MGVGKGRGIEILYKFPLTLQTRTPQIKARYSRKAYTPSDMIQKDREHHLSLSLYPHICLKVIQGTFGKDTVPCSTQNDGST